jgi:hypothetical protein
MAGCFSFVAEPRFLVLLLAGAACGCSPSSRAYGVYAHDTRQLVRLDYDYDRDGRVDVRTYMRDGKAVRLEGDTNADGRIDRWEYYGAAGELLRIGASTTDDGREDTWIRLVGDERHVDISTRRDGVVDRHEVYRDDVLLRADSDTNHDGLADRWEEFAGGVLTRVLVDEHRRLGRPTRRISYIAGGEARVERIEGAADAPR